MHKIFIIFFFFLSAIVNAQSKQEKEVAAAIGSLYKAIIDTNKNMLEKLTADQLSYGHSSGKVEDKAAFVQGVLTGPFDFVTIDISNQTINLVGKTAIVRHIFTSKILNKGIPDTLKLGVLMVWQKQKGKWKLLARQAVKV